MPGKRITDHQVHTYKQHRNKLSQVASAAKTGISERSARRIEHASSLPSQRPKRNWRTREDPLGLVWDSEVVPLLKSDVHLNAVTLLEELQRRYPGHWDNSVLRTLQRRVRLWRAQFGAEREVYFAQEHPPGRQGISDFTVTDSLKVKIGGALFKHRLYQFALAHSGWRHVTVIEGGESFLALSTGLQAALWALGGSPEEHRTDSLSAAFNNLEEQEELTRRYVDLCRHYGLRATRCNPGQSNENGSVEARHNTLKNTLDQALRLRGTRSFETRADYDAFVNTIVQRMNVRSAKLLAAERAMLRPLPARRTAEFEEIPARVSKFAIFTLKGVLYSVPSQLIGHRLMIRQYAQHVEGWLGGQCVVSLPRAKAVEGQRVGRSIDYRHLVGALKRKPGAFARWVLRDAAFPRAVYRQTWERLSAQRPEREACKTMVGLLALAADGHEAQLAQELQQLIKRDQLPELNALSLLLQPPKTVVPPGQTESLASDVLELRKLDNDLDLEPKLVMLKVVSKKKSGSAYDSSEIRNLVFVSDDSETMKWVFPSQDQELVSVHPLKNSTGDIKGIYVEAVAKSSEAKASGFHLSSIYLVSADGTSLKKVLSDVDEIVNRRNDAHKLRLIYKKKNTVRMAQIDLQDFKVLNDRELAKMSEFKNYIGK